MTKIQPIDERLRLEEMVSGISAKFINLPARDVDAAIGDGLKLIAEFFGVEHAHIAEFLPATEDWYVSHVWLSKDCPDKVDIYCDGQIVPFAFPELTSRLIGGGELVFGSPDEIPEGMSGAREFVRNAGIKAGVVLRLSVGGAFLGGIMLHSYGIERRWSKNEVARLHFIGTIFANALIRKRSEQEIQKSHKEIKRLKDRLQAENIYLREEIKIAHSHEEIIGQSEAIKRVLFQAEQVAETDSTVLVLGETGTGKELLARAIHRLSLRKGRSMVNVNCAALPESLVESELFGHEKGAYTGAMTKQIGRFEIADGSTIFLDEISEMSLGLQAKLLRVLQENCFERIGSTRTTKVDVRVIAATNRDLAAAVSEGLFRGDLYYRLNVFPVSMPPLWERKGDIPLLVEVFIKEFEVRMGKAIKTIPHRDMEALQRYSWPGNVRELKNIIERAMIISEGPVLRLDLPEGSLSTSRQGMMLRDVERRHILSVLDRAGWRVRGKDGAAEILGLKPSTLESRMTKHGIKRTKP